MLTSSLSVLEYCGVLPFLFHNCNVIMLVTFLLLQNECQQGHNKVLIRISNTKHCMVQLPGRPTACTGPSCFRLMFGSCGAAQWRLQGPGKWSEATNAVRNVPLTDMMNASGYLAVILLFVLLYYILSFIFYLISFIY